MGSGAHVLTEWSAEGKSRHHDDGDDDGTLETRPLALCAIGLVSGTASVASTW